MSPLVVRTTYKISRVEDPRPKPEKVRPFTPVIDYLDHRSDKGYKREVYRYENSPLCKDYNVNWVSFIAAVQDYEATMDSRKMQEQEANVPVLSTRLQAGQQEAFRKAYRSIARDGMLTKFLKDLPDLEKLDEVRSYLGQEYCAAIENTANWTKPHARHREYVTLDQHSAHSHKDHGHGKQGPEDFDARSRSKYMSH